MPHGAADDERHRFRLEFSQRAVGRASLMQQYMTQLTRIFHSFARVEAAKT